MLNTIKPEITSITGLTSGFLKTGINLVIAPSTPPIKNIVTIIFNKTISIDIKSLSLPDLVN